MAKNKNKKVFLALEQAKAKVIIESMQAEVQLNNKLNELNSIETASQEVGVDLLEFGNNYIKVAEVLRKSGATKENIKAMRVLYGLAKKK